MIITAKLPEAIVPTSTKKVIHFKEMDELTTEEEIRGAIVKATSIEPHALAKTVLQPA